MRLARGRLARSLLLLVLTALTIIAYSEGPADSWSDSYTVYPPWNGSGFLDNSFEEDRFYFDALVGDLIVIEATAADGKDMDVELHAPGGIFPVGSADTWFGFTAHLAHTATVSGRYEVRLKPNFLEKTPIYYTLSISFLYRPGTTTTTYWVAPSTTSTSSTTLPSSTGPFPDVREWHPYLDAIAYSDDSGHPIQRKAATCRGTSTQVSFDSPWWPL